MIESILRKDVNVELVEEGTPIFMMLYRTSVDKCKTKYTRKLYYNRDSKCIGAEMYYGKRKVKSIGGIEEEKVKYIVTLSTCKSNNNLLSIRNFGYGSLAIKYIGDIFNFRRNTKLNFNVDELEYLNIDGYLTKVLDIEIL